MSNDFRGAVARKNEPFIPAEVMLVACLDRGSRKRGRPPENRLKCKTATVARIATTKSMR